MSTAKEVADAFQSIDIAFDRNRFLSRLLLFIGKAGCHQCLELRYGEHHQRGV